MSSKVIFVFVVCLLFFAESRLKGQTEELFESRYGIEVSVDAKKVNIRKLLRQEGITLDHGLNREQVNLYVTKQGYDYLMSNEVEFVVKKHKPFNCVMKSYDEIIAQKNNGDCLPAFDYYPTYEAYEQLMKDYENRYPELCKLDTIYTWNNGRQLLVLNIGDNIGELENEPGFLYSSSMHGDELAGYPTMIKLIDHLLCNYGDNERITKMVDEINIFINPLANPNGAYTNDNSTVQGARRENASFIDLNRNYPDPDEGENPDGRSYQSETLAFIDFARKNKINMSCNIHGGAELLNYPWDTYFERHADDDWWIHVCRNYADTAQHYSENGYLEQFGGIVNGYDWYPVAGGRQDYMTFFERGREFTLEISNQKTLDSDQLPKIWESNREALLNYMNEALFGLRGQIIDCISGVPLEAHVLIEGHDNKNSSVFSNEENGAYFRYLKEGNYLISYIVEGYDTLIQEINIIDKSSTIYDVEMCKTGTSTTIENLEKELIIYNSGNELQFIGQGLDNNMVVDIYDLTGRKILSSPLIDKSIKLISNIPTALYWVQLSNSNVSAGKMLLIK